MCRSSLVMSGMREVRELIFGRSGAAVVRNWYANRAHRGDQDPRFDPANDDPRDPFEFGAVQEQRATGEPRRGSRAKRRRAAVKGRNARATQNGDQQVSPPAKVPCGDERRTAVEAIVLSVLRDDPEPTFGQYQRAVRAAGYGELDRAEVRAVFQRIAAKRRARQMPANVQKGRPARVARLRAADNTVRVVAAERCPSCDVVPDRLSGACRCG
jgi:hypothetical protein